MNIQEHKHLLAEHAELCRLIEHTPETDAIDRKSLEARKSAVEEALTAVSTPSREPVSARLTFRGKPVIGNYGIFAGFGTKAIDAFSYAVATMGTSQTMGLGTRGALPRREGYPLLITGTALGSFGFELEESPKEGDLFPERSIIEPAIEQTRKIMEASIMTDDDLTEAIADANPRAVEALRRFLQFLADQEAICALEFKEKVFRFADVGQVRRSAGRLQQDNIHEEDKQFAGKFLGVLPHRRTFEFQVADQKEIMVGKVGWDIQNAASINHVLEQDINIKVHTKCAGRGRPKYTLLSYEQQKEQASEGQNEAE